VKINNMARIAYAIEKGRIIKHQPRIAFSIEDADHLYELSLEHFQPGCYSCDKIKKRLEKFIGPNRVRQTKRAVKKNPI